MVIPVHLPDSVKTAMNSTFKMRKRRLREAHLPEISHDRCWSRDSKPGLSFLRGQRFRKRKQGFLWLIVVGHIGVSRFCTVNAALQASSGHVSISWHLQAGLDSPSLSLCLIPAPLISGHGILQKAFLTLPPPTPPETWAAHPPITWARRHFR